ncbi:MFS general substrate transporter [Penicillium canescens]|nr:MFS general substrate transporter [Penicillium canescens]
MTFDILVRSPGMSGLAFLNLVMAFYSPWASESEACCPEAHLLGGCIGGVSLAVGLFWFAWTSRPDIHWAWSIAAGVPFGFGVALITIGSTNYLVDSYTAFAATALTVCNCARAVCGALAPLLV